MKRYLVIFSILILAVSVSCKNRHRVKAAEKHMETLSTENSDSTFVNDAFSNLENEFDFDTDSTDVIEDSPVTLFAILERGACFGRCPIFKMAIYQSGNATYEGINFVDSLGTYSTVFTTAELAEITSQAKLFGLDTMKTKYDQNGVTDLPTTMIGATMSGEYKAIKMRYGYPNGLKKYRTYLENVIKSKTWTLIAKKEGNNN
jgi:hypothetical protein